MTADPETIDPKSERGIRQWHGLNTEHALELTDALRAAEARIAAALAIEESTGASYRDEIWEETGFNNARKDFRRVLSAPDRVQETPQP